MNSNRVKRRPVAGLFPGLLPALMLALFPASCGPKETGPVELFPEDQCGSCRMAISSPAFASEIVYGDGSAAKFDDLRCLDDYRKAHPDEEYAAIFVMNYDTKEWIPYGRSVIVQTGIETPMGSGRVAVGEQRAASRLKEQYPAKLASAEGGGRP